MTVKYGLDILCVVSNVYSSGVHIGNAWFIVVPVANHLVGKYSLVITATQFDEQKTARMQ